MKIIKKYKWLLLLLLFVLLITGLLIKNFWFYSNESMYGNRLEGIKDVPIRSDLQTDIINSLVLLPEVEEASINITGKIINILIDINVGVEDDNYKVFADNTLIKFTDEQINFYDIQFFITQETISDNDDFPIIGYKNKTSQIVVWDGN